MRLAVIGDIHVYKLFVAPWHLFGKAAVGHANLLLRRRHVFRLELLPYVLQRVIAVRPDGLIFPGDFTTTATPAEFRAVSTLLRPLLDSPAVSIAVPGNHDRYSFLAASARRFERAVPQAVVGRYPSLVRLTDRWHVLALNSSVPRLVSSRGYLGAAQLDEARRLIAPLTPEHGLIVLTHYAVGKPPRFPPTKWGHRLADADAFLGLLRAFRGQALFVHGHVHFPWRWPRPEPGLEHVTDLNAGAPCLVGAEYPGGQGFWEVELPERPGDPLVTTHHHLLSMPAGGDEIEPWAAEHVL